MSLVYSFYSSTEDVLGTMAGTPTGTTIESALHGFGPYAWVAQEKAKGLMSGNSILSSNHGGWRFNDAALNPVSYTTYTVAMANVIPDAQLQTNAFFDFGWHTFGSNHPDYDHLQGTDGSDYAAANRNRILADAIPAETLPIGANPVTRLQVTGKNFDMQALYENGWPVTTGSEAYNWHHSDICNVAYPYTYNVFNAIVSDANLK